MVVYYQWVISINTHVILSMVNYPIDIINHGYHPLPTSPAPGGRCAAPPPSATAPRRGPPSSGGAETPRWPGGGQPAAETPGVSRRGNARTKWWESWDDHKKMLFLWDNNGKMVGLWGFNDDHGIIRRKCYCYGIIMMIWDKNIWILWDYNDDFWDLSGKNPMISWNVHGRCTQKNIRENRGEHVKKNQGKSMKPLGKSWDVNCWDLKYSETGWNSIFWTHQNSIANIWNNWGINWTLRGLLNLGKPGKIWRTLWV